MSRGYLVAIGGLTIFVIAVIVGATFRIDGAAGTVLALGSCSLMALLFCAGTALVAVDKGYNVAVGIVLGLIAPLGLLIVTLMPRRG